MHFELNSLVFIGFATITGYYAGLFSKRFRLPSLIGYIFIGVLLGSSFLNIINDQDLDRLAFISEITLAFIAFSIGSELSIASLKKIGMGIVTVIFAESFMAFLLVTALILIVTRDLPLALVFGAMAPASDPAGTVYVIQETRSRGNLTKALYAVVGFDDGLAIVIFGFATAAAKHLLTGETDSAVKVHILSSLLYPFAEILFSLLAGVILGLVFSVLMRLLKRAEDSLILVFGFVMLSTGIALSLSLSHILINMVVGFVFVNTQRVELVKRVLRRTHTSTPFLYILFFCLAGAHMKFSALPAIGLIGIVYIIGRSAGLISGAMLGAAAGGMDEKIKKYLGIGILSQAGVAIGLALIARNELTAIGTSHAARIGAAVLTMTTATSIFFELIGPIFTKFALERAGEIPAHRSHDSEKS